LAVTAILPSKHHCCHHPDTVDNSSGILVFVVVSRITIFFIWSLASLSPSSVASFLPAWLLSQLVWNSVDALVCSVLDILIVLQNLLPGSLYFRFAPSYLLLYFLSRNSLVERLDISYFMFNSFLHGFNLPVIDSLELLNVQVNFLTSLWVGLQLLVNLVNSSIQVGVKLIADLVPVLNDIRPYFF